MVEVAQRLCCFDTSGPGQFANIMNSIFFLEKVIVVVCVLTYFLLLLYGKVINTDSNICSQILGTVFISIQSYLEPTESPLTLLYSKPSLESDCHAPTIFISKYLLNSTKKQFSSLFWLNV